MNAIVKAEGLSKSYGSVKAMDQVSFTVEKGSIVGLLGPNGAGKTTTLKALMGLTDFEGDLQVLGMDPRSGRHHIMEKVCFIADVGILPRWLKVSEAIDYIEGVHPGFYRERAEALLAETKITLNQKVKQLSKGMVTQLHLALILAIDVDLLVLDEPTLGLDILYQKAFYDRILDDYFDHETSIIISTHQVEDVKSILSHLLFIDEGRIVLDSSMDEIAEIYSEVLVPPELIEKALSLEPFHVSESLGKKSMLFEGADKNLLAELGEIHVPSITELFVAKMQKSQGEMK